MEFELKGIIPKDARRLISRSARKVAELRLLEADLKFATACLSESMNTKSELIDKALFNAAVIAYGRCFNSGDGRKVLKIVEPFSKDQKETHSFLMRLRNAHVAHSASDFEQCLYVVALLPGHDGKPDDKILKGEIIAEFSRPLREEKVKYLSLMQDVLDKIVRPDLAKHQAAVDKEAAALSLDEIRALPVAKLADPDLTPVKRSL